MSHENCFHIVVRGIHCNESRLMLCKNSEADIGQVERINSRYFITFLCDEPKFLLKHITLFFKVKY